MAQEVRDIILSLDEVRCAFECYQRMNPDFLPHDAIVACRMTEDGVVVTAGARALAPQREIALRGIDLLRPLIRFCIENNIMLPRDGKKSIRIEKDKITMHIELDLDTDIPALHAPMRAAHISSIRRDALGNFVAIAREG